MKTNQAAAAALCLLLSVASAWSQPVGTAFTYQGRLVDGAGPANGTYDLQFTLFDAVTAGAQMLSLKAQVGRIAELERRAAPVEAQLQSLAQKPAAAVASQVDGTEKRRSDARVPKSLP